MEQNDTKTQPQPSSQPFSSPSTNQSKRIFVVGVFVALLVGGAGGYVLGTKITQTTNSLQYTQQQQVTTTPTITTDPSLISNSISTEDPATTNWKTYTNTKMGFEVKYPPRYPKPHLPSGSSESPAIYADENSEDAILFGETSTDSFSVVVFPFNGGIQELLNSTEAKRSPPYNWVPSDDILLLTKNIMVDGVNAKWITAAYKRGKGIYTGIFFIKGNYGVIISPSPDHDEKEINQILSTFHFTN